MTGSPFSSPPAAPAAGKERRRPVKSEYETRLPPPVFGIFKTARPRPGDGDAGPQTHTRRQICSTGVSDSNNSPELVVVMRWSGQQVQQMLRHGEHDGMQAAFPDLSTSSSRPGIGQDERCSARHEVGKQPQQTSPDVTAAGPVNHHPVNDVEITPVRCSSRRRRIRQWWRLRVPARKNGAQSGFAPLRTTPGR